MQDDHAARLTLRRLFVNGPLASLPAKPADQDFLVELAAARFEPGRTYSEAEVNELLEPWLATFCEPAGIDHVTMRRMLVDSRRLVRTSSGSHYQADTRRAAQAAALAAIDPAAILAEVRAERDERKRQQQRREP